MTANTDLRKQFEYIWLSSSIAVECLEDIADIHRKQLTDDFESIKQLARAVGVLRESNDWRTRRKEWSEAIHRLAIISARAVRLGECHETSFHAAALALAQRVVDEVDTTLYAVARCFGERGGATTDTLLLWTYRQWLQKPWPGEGVGFGELKMELESEAAKMREWIAQNVPQPKSGDNRPDRRHTEDPRQPEALSVNARMLDTLTKKPESKEWTTRQWGEYLGYGKSTIADQPVWKGLEAARQGVSYERMERKGRSRKHPDKQPHFPDKKRNSENSANGHFPRGNRPFFMRMATLSGQKTRTDKGNVETNVNHINRCPMPQIQTTPKDIGATGVTMQTGC
jgi:hypothetical protein